MVARTCQIGIINVMIRKIKEASKGERIYSKYGPMKLIQTYARVPYIWGLRDSQREGPSYDVDESRRGGVCVGDR